MRTRHCCKVCFVVQLISIYTLVCGAIAIWGAIELSEQNWDQAPLFVKFSCIAAGFLVLNIGTTGTFYCIVWRRAVRKERVETAIQLARPGYGSNGFVTLHKSESENSSTSEVPWGPDESAIRETVESWDVVRHPVSPPKFVDEEVPLPPNSSEPKPERDRLGPDE